MSHQVKLSELAYTDLELLKKAIAEEGLKIKDTVEGYYTRWQKGASYGRNQTVEFGIEVGKSCPCGVVSNKDGTYDIVGDEWGVSYQGTHGLKQLSSNIAQRYRIEQVKKAAKSSGWDIVDAPNIMLPYNSKDNLEIKLKKRATAKVGACY